MLLYFKVNSNYSLQAKKVTTEKKKKIGPQNISWRFKPAIKCNFAEYFTAFLILLTSDTTR